MGLDSNLYVKIYTWPDDGARDLGNKIMSLVLGDELLEKTKPYFEPESFTIEVAYWRKANHVHGWFVENVQGGVDDCKEHVVTVEELEKLLSTCKEVMKDRSKAPFLLPVTPGFFFGSMEYDDRYFEMVDYTIRAINKILQLVDYLDGKGWYYDILYGSSW